MVEAGGVTALQRPELAERLRGALPRSLVRQVDEALSLMPVGSLAPTTKDVGPIVVAGETIRIPFRIYSPEPDAKRVAALDEPSRRVLDALYSRHHDGLVRERCARRLVDASEAWVAPFVLQLVGEYVVEIIEFIAASPKVAGHPGYASFLAGNSAYAELLRRRVVSYWSCFFRDRWPQFEDHPAYRLLHGLSAWDARDARRLLSR